MNGYNINRKIRRWTSVTALASFGLLFFVGTVLADCSVSFSWRQNPASNITGYRIYYGQTESGPYPNVINVGNPAAVDGRIKGTVPNLVCDKRYYFVCVAVYDGNIESGYSGEVTVVPNGAAEVQIPVVPGVEIIK